MNNRDAYVTLLKTLVSGWKAQQELLKPDQEKEFLQFQILIRKTNIFLRDEFGEV